MTDMLDRTLQLPVREISGLRLDPSPVISLPNGIDIIVESDRDMEAVSRVSVVLEGGRAESLTNAVSTLSVSQMREGAAGISGAEIADRIDTAGAWIQDSSVFHFRSLTLNTLNRNACENIELLAKMIEDPVYPEAVLRTNTERLASRLEIESRKAAFIAGREADRLVLGEGHPLLNTDTPDGIRGIRREDVSAMHSDYGNPGGIKVYVSGNIDDGLLKPIEKIFGSLGCKSKQNPNLNIESFHTSVPGVRYVKLPDSCQAAINIQMPTIGRDDDDYIDLRLTIMALGGYFGSRLSSNIRESKGYTYGIQSFLLGMREGGIFKIVTECDPSYIEGVLEEVNVELGRLVSCPPEGEELLRVKRTALMSLASVAETAMTRLDYQIDGYKGGFDACDYYMRQLRSIEALSPERISEIASKYLVPDRLITVVVRP